VCACIDDTIATREDLQEVTPPGADSLTRPARGPEVPPVPGQVFEVEQVAVEGDRIDDAIAAREHRPEAEPASVSAVRRLGPAEVLTSAAECPPLGAVAGLVAEEEQVAVPGDRIENAVTAGKDAVDVAPAVSDLLTDTVECPARGAVSGLVSVVEELVIVADRVEVALVVTRDGSEAHPRAPIDTRHRRARPGVAGRPENHPQRTPQAQARLGAVVRR
jgi:hypothetical protein